MSGLVLNHNAVLQGLSLVPSGKLFALGQHGLYCLQTDGNWKEVVIPNDKGEKLSDITIKGDSLIITGRSYYIYHFHHIGSS